MDQLMCETLEWFKCGHTIIYRIIIDILLIPMFLKKELKDIAYFSGFALICTLLSILVSLALEIEIFSNPTSYARHEMGINL